MSQSNQFYQEAQAEVTRLEQERAALIIKLSGPHLKSDEREQIGLRIQEIARALPDVWVQAGERQRRAEAKALAEKIEAQIAAKEQAKAAADEANRQAGIRQAALSAYLAQGGTTDGFEIAWIGIKQDLARDAALNAAQQAMQTVGNEIADLARATLRERYGKLPTGGEFLQPVFQGAAAGLGKFGDAFDIDPTPPDDVELA